MAYNPDSLLGRIKYSICMEVGFICPICDTPYYTRGEWERCHKKERQRRFRPGTYGCSGATANDTPIGKGTSPYPGGPNGAGGCFIDGGEYGGHFMGGSPYPGGPNGPGGCFIPNSGFVSYGPEHDKRRD